MGELQLNSISDIAGYDNLTKFDGFYDNRYYDPMVSGYGFIFVTKPSLFINPELRSGNYNELAYKNMTRDTYFSRFIDSNVFNESDKLLPKLLSYYPFNNVSSFIPMFTNKLKNLETSDIVMESNDAFDTKQGYRLPLPTTTTSSEAASQLSLSVTESSNMDFTKLMSLWVKYISNVTDGTFDAHPLNIRDGIIDYMCSIYYIALAPDGRTVKYWCKYTGCWPTTIPYSAMRYNKGDPQLVELDIPFLYTYKEDMTPDILQDFNIVSLKMNDNNLDKSGEFDKYLTRKSLEEINPDIFLNKYREPLIVKETDDNNVSNYILSFGESVNTNKFLRDVIVEKTKETVSESLRDEVTVDADNYFFSINTDDGFFKL